MYTNKNKQPFVGPKSALTDSPHIDDNYVFGEFGYKKIFEEKFTLKPRVYYDQFDVNDNIKALPNGTTVKNTSGVAHLFPNGLIGDGIVSEKVVGTEVPFDYELFDGNMITLGLEYRLINQTNGHSFANFNPITLEDLGSIQEISPSLPDRTQRIWAVYLQDTWDITDTLNLTLG